MLQNSPKEAGYDGSEFTTKSIRKWLNELGVKTVYIEPGSPWENGYIESFNCKLRDELLNGDSFCTLLVAKILIEHWRKEYNQVRPQSIGLQNPISKSSHHTAYIRDSALQFVPSTNLLIGTKNGGRPKA